MTSRAPHTPPGRACILAQGPLQILSCANLNVSGLSGASRGILCPVWKVAGGILSGRLAFLYSASSGLGVASISNADGSRFRSTMGTGARPLGVLRRQVPARVFLQGPHDFPHHSRPGWPLLLYVFWWGVRWLRGASPGSFPRSRPLPSRSCRTRFASVIVSCYSTLGCAKGPSPCCTVGFQIS